MEGEPTRDMGGEPYDEYSGSPFESAAEYRRVREANNVAGAREALDRALAAIEAERPADIQTAKLGDPEHKSLGQLRRERAQQAAAEESDDTPS